MMSDLNTPIPTNSLTPQEERKAALNVIALLGYPTSEEDKKVASEMLEMLGLKQ